MSDVFPDTDPVPSSDPLSDVLQFMRVARVIYCRSEFSAPWGLAIPPEKEAAVFHLVVNGRCVIRAGAELVTANAGDVVLLPRGSGHDILDHPDSPLTPIATAEREVIGDGAARLRLHRGGDRTDLICCLVKFQEPARHPLRDLIPELVHVKAGAPSDRVLPGLLQTMALENEAVRSGSSAIMTRLADLLILIVIRAWIETAAGVDPGWLTAIRDPHLGRALAAFHRRPDEPWTVPALANAAGLSRSLFSERFTALLGISPRRYINRWSMQRAGALLREGRSITEVATRLHYESDASFSRAFKRFSGRPPGEFQKASSLLRRAQ